VRRSLEAIRALRRELAAEKQTNSQLRYSQAQFRALVESSVDHIFMLDEKGVYLFSNDQVAAFGMRSGQELVGRRLQDVYPHDVCICYREKLKEVFARGRTEIFSHEREVVRGSEFSQNTLYPIHRDGRIWAVGGICRDMSEQKRIEKQLSQSQKMEALGTLVAGAAHEINNPVNLILFNLPLFEKIWRDLMPMLDTLDEQLQHSKFGGLTYDFIKQNMPRLISDMQMAATRVANIVNGLKQFSRKSNPAEKSDIQVNVAVENAARLGAATLSNSKTELKLDLASNIPLLHANLQNLEQIVLNLMINAHQSIDHDRGLVQITTGWRAQDQAIIVEVTDNGRGINPAVAEKIFDPFVTDRQAQGGTGIGLSVTYSLVKAHNGEISFESKPGQGTRFTIVFPTAAKPRPRRVMVVDDDSAFRALLIQTISRKTDFVAEGFANGAEALIRLGSYPPDLLVLDMFMPEIDGLQVCRAIKNELGLELMKVIIVTGFSKHPNVAAAERLGFTQILTKPLDMGLFIRWVKENLSGKST
jgi:PAS domain S-box-containing protein